MNALLPANVQRRRPSAAACALAGLVVAAWLLLAIWGASPYAAWLDHAEMEHIAAPPAVRLAVFTLGWTLMIVAMMLPPTLLLHRAAAGAPMRRVGLAPLLLTYLAVWAVFGSLGYAGDGALHELVEHAPGLGSFIAPGLLLLAGLYQLSPIKRACLARCRFEDLASQQSPAPSPAPSPPPNPWLLGLRHSLYCLGSCWALMLLMLAFGAAHLAWMFVLALLTAAERLTRHGATLAHLLGILLLLCWALLATGLTPWR